MWHKHPLRRALSSSLNRRMGLSPMWTEDPGPVPTGRSLRLVLTSFGRTISEIRTKTFSNGLIRGSQNGMTGGLPIAAMGDRGGMGTEMASLSGAVTKVRRSQWEAADSFKVPNGKVVWMTVQCTTMLPTTQTLTR